MGKSPSTEISDVPLLLAGFSFGAWVGLRVGCGDKRISELIGLGAPVNDSKFEYLAECAKPKLFVTGENDQFGNPATLQKLVDSFPAANRRQTQVVIVPGVDHFFAGKLEAVDSALADWLISRHPELDQSV